MPKQALIMIDMQRGFLDSASPLCIPAAEGTVPACAALIGRCHEAGVPVIYAVRHYRADGTDVEKPRAAAWASGGKPLSEDCAAHLSDAFPDAFTVLPQDYARAAAGERVAYAAQDYRTGVRMRFLLNDTLAALHYLRAGRIGVFLRSIADLFTAKEALRCRGDNRVFWVYLKNSLFARG